MKVGKPKSKRVTVRLRHKIVKASAAKQRKDRKEAKKNPQWRSRLKKDPGIPNLFPYKDRVLAEIEESKRKKEEEQKRRRDLARAQREGRNVDVLTPGATGKDDEDEDDDEELADVADDDDTLSAGDDDEMEEDTNPMAALLASAQARAQTFKHEDDGDDDDEEEDDGGADFEGFGDAKAKSNSATAPTKKSLPPQALADPVKAISALIERLENTQDGIQQLLGYYQLPPLITAGSDTTTRFLVDVARKRGRLGRGGIPNLHAASLMVLGDLNDERLQLPALARVPQPAGAAANKGQVKIVSQLAQPFRIEGLFGDGRAAGKTGAMDVDA